MRTLVDYKKKKRLFAMNRWISINGPADFELDLGLSIANC
jgi:hypothetical protein